MGRLILEQCDEQGRLLALYGSIPTALLLVWAFAAGMPAFYGYSLVPGGIRFRHVAAAGREAPMEEFLLRCEQAGGCTRTGSTRIHWLTRVP